MADNEWLEKDYYAVLGVDSAASDAEITKAYRRLARKYHPDVNNSEEAEDMFREISEAYDVLHNRENKCRYDTLWGASVRKPGISGRTGSTGSQAQPRPAVQPARQVIQLRMPPQIKATLKLIPRLILSRQALRHIRAFLKDSRACIMQAAVRRQVRICPAFSSSTIAETEITICTRIPETLFRLWRLRQKRELTETRA